MKSKSNVFISGTYSSFAGTDGQVKGLLPVLSLCGEFQQDLSSAQFMTSFSWFSHMLFSYYFTIQFCEIP
jgi:hypothetical protein